jgi:site-specific DNA-methyltransferase (adenine-specific)
MSELTRNPDILTCLANLSNDEVFTPPEVANAMLDLIPEDFWKDPNVRVLDPACKSGVFLREAAKRFLKGEEEAIPDLKERIDHIFHKQLFGYAITELTSHLSRRTVYCSKTANGKYSVTPFKSENGNIAFSRVEHTWEDGKCKYCGASQEVFDKGAEAETHAYKFIHLTSQQIKDLDMKFDLIIGNPPYQLNDGGSGTGISAKPIYHLFVEKAKQLRPRYLCMIIPSRWFAGGKGLDDFRESMLNDPHIRIINDFMSSKDCFPGVNIAGGVNYFLWDRDNAGECTINNCTSNGVESTEKRTLNEFNVLIRDNRAVNIIHKFQKSKDPCLTDNTYKRNPFGFSSSERGAKSPDSIDSKKMIKLISSEGVGYINKDDVKKCISEIDNYKVTIGKVVPSNGEVDTNPADGYKVITTPRIIEPGVIHTESYLLLHGFKNKTEADYFAHYMTLKFPRFMMKQTLSSMNISSENFRFVPFLSYDHKWTDEELYERYGLDDNERKTIEATIRSMDMEK